MGVMLDAKANPAPTEEELARAAGLVPGGPEMQRFEEMRRELDEKGFLVTTTDDLFTWARTGMSKPGTTSFQRYHSVPPWKSHSSTGTRVV